MSPIEIMHACSDFFFRSYPKPRSDETVYMVVRRARGIMEQIKGMDASQMAELMWKSCRETNDAAKAGVQTNYYGVKNVTEALLPLLLQASSSGGGRVVNVSSDFGLLRVSCSGI